MARIESSEGLDRFNRIAVLVATWCAIPFFFVLLASAAVTGRADLAVGSATPALIAAVGLWQLRRPDPRAVPQLITGAVMTLFYMIVVDTAAHGGAIAALVTLGMTGLLLLRRGIVPYVATFAAAILANSVLIDSTGRSATDRMMSAAGSVLLFVFAAGMVVWLRRELETGRARYRSLFERAPVAIWAADFSAVRPWLEARRAEGVADLGAYLAARPDRAAEALALVEVLDVNRAALDQVDATHKSQLVGRVEPESVGLAFREVGMRQLASLWQDQSSGQLETEAITYRGRKVSLVVSWSIPRVRRELDLASVVTTITDVTELKRAKQRLERLVATKDEFVASVSHELRTPLTSVVGLASELNDRYAAFSRDERRELIGLITEQSSEMAYITEDLLVAAHPDIGHLAIRPVPLDMRVEVARVIRDIGQEAAGIEIRAGNLPLTLADPNRVRQILRNLLINAFRHGGPHVSVHLAGEGDISVAVRDDGAAIPEAERDSIFEPYHRAQRSGGRPASVGLGLTVSRQLARRMGGDVTYSRDAGHNVFVLQLPPAGPESGRPPAARRSGPSVRLW